MSHSQTASAALLASARAGRASVADAINAYRHADNMMREADDIMEVFAAVAALILAAEDLAEVAKRQGAEARAALATTMQETGGTQFRIPSHTVSVQSGGRRAEITDQSRLPAEYLVTPAPKPDMVRLGADLRAGVVVPGAVLSNGGAPFVKFHPLKDASA